jgi:hypothetical protein
LARIVDVLYLQAPAVILEEQGDGTPVCMCGTTSCPMLFQRIGWHGWIMQKPELVVMSRMLPQKMVLIIEAEADR